jgi:hypothetical protein
MSARNAASPERVVDSSLVSRRWHLESPIGELGFVVEFDTVLPSLSGRLSCFTAGAVLGTRVCAGGLGRCKAVVRVAAERFAPN